MTLTITDSVMTSTMTDHQAAKMTRGGVWSCTWCPDLKLDRNQAVTAMTIAEEVSRALESGSNVADVGLIASLARELDLLCVDAVQMVMAAHALPQDLKLKSEEN